MTVPEPRVAPDVRRKFILAIVLAVQLMIAVDITVVNIALPQIQHHLGFSPAELSSAPWRRRPTRTCAT